MKLDVCSLGILFAIGGAATEVLAGCVSVRVVTPAAGAIIADGRPIVTWEKVEDAKRYRVLSRSQVPNGQVVQEIDNWGHDSEYSRSRRSR